MNNSKEDSWIRLDTNSAIWNHFFTVAPLVVIGTKENNGYDLAPKHMATPLGHDNFFGFVCTPKHATYHNVKETNEFTVSFVRPDQVVLASLTASGRCDDDKNGKLIIHGLPTSQGSEVDALTIDDSYLILECTLDRIVDGFGEFSLVAGKVIAARVQKDSLRISDVDEAQSIYNAPLLAYLAYGRFSEIRNTRSFPFPKDFEQGDLVQKMDQ